MVEDGNLTRVVVTKESLMQALSQIDEGLDWMEVKPGLRQLEDSIWHELVVRQDGRSSGLHRDEFVADLQAWISYWEETEPRNETEETELAVLRTKAKAFLRDEFGVTEW